MSGRKTNFTKEYVVGKIYELNPNIKWVDVEYINAKTKLKFECLLDGHIFYRTFDDLKRSSECPKCVGRFKSEEDLFELEKQIKAISPNIQINMKKSNGTKVYCTCTIDGHMWETTWKRLLDGTNCRVCWNSKMSKERSIPNEGNKLSINRPDLIRYFKYKDRANQVAVFSKNKEIFVCPDCGTEKEISVGNLSTYGFKCPQCSDGISVPEKFIFSVLSQIGVDFEFQYKFKSIKNKRYDFFIKSLNIIIETHGIQHYDSIGWGKNTFDIKDNDLEKEKLAINVGVSKYISVDCSYSEFEWLINETKKSLSDILDISNVNYDIAYKNAMSSKVVQTWSLFNEGKTINEIVKILKTTRGTVRSYLKRGNALNITNYIPFDRKKPVGQYNLNGELISSFNSEAEASLHTGVAQSKIGLVCQNLRKTSGGFIWKFL